MNPDDASNGQALSTSPWQRLGGDEPVRKIMSAFICRVRSDIMIGFFFRNTAPKRLEMFEFQHASSHLGGPHRYRGRPMALAHAHLPIAGGHFSRRRRILAEVLQEHAVPQDIAVGWLAAQDALRDQVVRLDPSACPSDM